MLLICFHTPEKDVLSLKFYKIDGCLKVNSLFRFIGSLTGDESSKNMKHTLHLSQLCLHWLYELN